MRSGDNDEGPPFSSSSWGDDRRGGDIDFRRHGSSEDRSRSLTPAMVVEEADEGWLLDDEETQRMERRRGPPRGERGDWNNGNGRTRVSTGDRERQRDEVDII